MNSFQLLRFTYSGCLACLRGKKDLSDKSLAFSSLFGRTNFILPSTDAARLMATERKLLNALGKIWRANKAGRPDEGIPLHLHNSVYGAPVWKDFLDSQVAQPIGRSLLVFDFISPRTFSRKLSASFSLLLLYPLLRRLAWSRSCRLNALVLSQAFLVALNLANELEKKGIKKIYYTGFYDPEANYLSLVLKKSGVEVAAAVSGTPLFRFLDTLVADELLLTNYYQKEECGYFSDTIKAAKITVLPPLTYRSFIGQYRGKTLDTPAGTIGIYTSGIW